MRKLLLLLVLFQLVSCSSGENGSRPSQGDSDPASEAAPVCPQESVGARCTDGTIYAGEMLGKKYVTTPGGCEDSSNPTCDGSMDTLAKTWVGTGGSLSNFSDLYNVNFYEADINSGAHNTIRAFDSGVLSSDSAIHFCKTLTFGGHTDWFLPNIQELKLMHKDHLLIGGFASTDYITSSEGPAAETVLTGILRLDQNFGGVQRRKDIPMNVRCMRNIN